MREAMDVFQDGQTSGGNQLASPDVKRIIGLLEAPSIGLSVMMVDYLSYSDLETAAARMTNSAPFGVSGQTVVTGHRTGFGQPFFDLDRLKVGATISVTLKDTSVLNYIVRDQKIVSPDANLSEFDQSNSPSQLILVTCDPKYSTDFRLLVIAELSGDATEPA
jgi:sortase A